MQNFKAKMKYTFMETLVEVIDKAFRTWTDEEDRVLLCVLMEVRATLLRRMLVVDTKKEYKISFTPAQAFALRQLSIHVTNADNFIGNGLRQISENVHKQYSKV